MTITKEGALASFYTVNKAPIKHLKVYFSPKQAGSGDASPENIREISGWQSLTLSRAQKNLGTIQQLLGDRPYTEVTEDGRQCVYVQASGTTPISFKNAFKSNTQYTISFWAKPVNKPDYTSTSPFRIRIYYTDGTSGLLDVPSANINVWSSYTFTSKAGQTIDYLQLGSYEFRMMVYFDKNTFQIKEGTQAATYEPYKGTTQIIDWSSTLGAIYGGYIDLITGELVQEQIGQTFKGSDADQVTELTNTNKFRFRFYKALKGNGATKAGITYCDRLQYQYHESDSLHYYFTANNSNGNAYVYLPKDFGDNDEVTIIASLYTPELVATLTPAELKTFIGYNNIWSNADRVEVEYDLAESNDELYRRRNIILQGAPHQEQVEDTIAHFNTDLNSSVTEAKFYFTPAQLAGTPSPSNIIPIYGYNNLTINISGKNMLNCNGISDGTAHGITFTQHKNSEGIVDYITCSGTMDTKNTFRNLTPINIGANDDSDVHLPYGHISFCTYGNNSNILPMRPDGGYGGFTGTDHGGINASANWYDWNTDIYNDRVKSWARIQVVPNEVGTIIDENVYPMMCHYLDRGCNFEPYYGNTTSIIFPTVGKNLLDITRTEKINPGANTSNITISNGVISIDAVASSARSYVLFAQDFPAGTYTIQVQKSGAVGSPRLLTTSEISNSSYNTYYTLYSRQMASDSLTFTLTQTSKIGLVLSNLTNESGNPGTLYDIQLESGSTATSYEPYTNTIYGGYVDLINGKLIQTYKKIDLGDFNWSYYVYANCSGGYTFGVTDNEVYSGNTMPNAYCSALPITTDNDFNDDSSTSASLTININNMVKVKIPNVTNAASLKSALAGIKLVYQLKTPIEYPLTPQTLKALKGTNNIWSNANGPVSITYWTH